MLHMKVGLAWSEMMQLPALLETPLRGVFAKIEGMEMKPPAYDTKHRCPQPGDLLA